MHIIYQHAKRLYVWFLVATLLSGCAGGRNSGPKTILQAIESSAEEIAGRLPPGSRVAIAGFNADHDNLSDFIIGELTGALETRDIEVTERRNLEYLREEFKFQMDGAVREDAVKVIGNFQAADVIITGQLRNIGDSYRFLVSAKDLEDGMHIGSARLDVRGGRKTRRMITTIIEQPTIPVGEGQRRLPHTPGTFLDRGTQALSRRDYGVAIMDFTEAIRLDPYKVAPHVLRGLARYYRGEYESAIEDYSRAIELNSNLPHVHNNRGVTFVSLKNYESAITDYDRAIWLNPNYSLAYFNRGLAHRNMGNQDMAVADYNRAIQLDQNIAGAYLNRANVHLEKMNYTAAIADYNHAIRLDPALVEAYNGRAYAHYRKGLLDLAIGDWETSLQRKPNDAEVKHNLISAYIDRGEAHLNKKNYDRAIVDYNRVILMDAGHVRAYNRRGYAYFRLDRLDVAISDWETSLQINPNDTEIRSNLETVRQQRLRGQNQRRW